MNRMNKVLLHVGMIAAISGTSCCYASSSMSEMPLGGGASDPRDVLDIFNNWDSREQGDFLSNIRQDWFPYLFKTLPMEMRRHVLDKNKAKLQKREAELQRQQVLAGKGPVGVMKLTDAARRLLGDIEVQKIDQYTVRLSKPLPELSTPEDRSVIICYEKDEFGNWKDIFGNTKFLNERYGRSEYYYYNDKVASIDFYTNPYTSSGPRPFGVIKYHCYSDDYQDPYIDPRIVISKDRMTISCNPVSSFIFEDEMEDTMHGVAKNKATE